MELVYVAMDADVDQTVNANLHANAVPRIRKLCVQNKAIKKFQNHAIVGQNADVDLSVDADHHAIVCKWNVNLMKLAS